MNKAASANSRKIRWLLPIALFVIIAVAGTLILFGQGGLLNHSPAGGETVAAQRSYVGQVVRMQRIQPVIADGKIKVKLDDVLQASIVGFETVNDLGEPVPMMVYIKPSGYLYAGTAQCACGGSTFFLAGRALVCDTCRSTYDIENQSFLSGAAICSQYPPESMALILRDATVEIEQQDVLQWRNDAGKIPRGGS